MQQELEKNGLNPNPMFFWKYVMSRTHKTVPCVAVFGEWGEGLTHLMEQRPDISFRYEMFGKNDKVISARNVLAVFLDRTEYHSWIQSRTTVDYLLCDKNEKNIWWQSQFCGVKCVFSLEELAKELETAHTLTSVERIENWELAKGLA